MNKKAALMHWIIFGVLAALGLFFVLTMNVDSGTEQKGLWQVSFIRAFQDAEKDILSSQQTTQDLIGIEAKKIIENSLKGDLGCGTWFQVSVLNNRDDFCEFKAVKELEQKLNSSTQQDFNDNNAIGSYDSLNNFDNYIGDKFYFQYYYSSRFEADLAFYLKELNQIKKDAKSIVNTCRNKNDLKPCLDENKKDSWYYDSCQNESFVEIDRKIIFCRVGQDNIEKRFALDFTPSLSLAVYGVTVTQKNDNDFEVKFPIQQTAENYIVYYTDYLPLKSKTGQASQIFSQVPLGAGFFKESKKIAKNEIVNDPNKCLVGAVKEDQKAYLCNNEIIINFDKNTFYKQRDSYLFTVTSTLGTKESAVVKMVETSDQIEEVVETTIVEKTAIHIDNFPQIRSLVVNQLDENKMLINPYGDVPTIYLSENGGKTWEKVFESGYDLKADKNNPNTIYALGSSTVYKSINFGKTWELLSGQFSGPRNILIDKKIPGRLYLFSKIEESGVFISEDNGNNWNFVSFGINDKNNPHMIVWDVGQDDNYIYAVGETRMYVSEKSQGDYRPPVLRSADSGLTWENIFPDNTWHMYSMEIDEAAGDVYFHREFNGLFKLSKGENQVKSLAPFHYGGAMVSNEKHPGEVYFGEPAFEDCLNREITSISGTHRCRYENGELWRTKDGGKTYELLLDEELYIADLYFNTDYTKLYVSTYGQGLFIYNLEDLDPFYTIKAEDWLTLGLGELIPPEKNYHYTYKKP